MKIFKMKYIQILALLFLTFSLQNCATKKNTFSNETIVIKSNTKDKLSEKNILYVVDGKEVNASFIKRINPSHIEKMTVLKDKKEIAKHTDKEYDGVIIIELKR